MTQVTPRRDGSARTPPPRRSSARPSPKSALKRVVYSSIPLKCLFWITLGLRTWANNLRGKAWYNIGSTHFHKTLDESIAYIESVVADYRRYGDIERFEGRVAELGPGDSAGVAMLLRGRGATRVELIERYQNDRRAAHHALIYRTLAERHGLEWLDPGGRWLESSLDGIEWRIGRSAEEVLRERARAGAPAYEYVLSAGMLEHADDPALVLEQAVACLSDGGKLVHRLDLDDHNLFSRTHPELTFLRIPHAVHRAMIMARSGPNRIRIDGYLRVLDRLRAAGTIDYHVHVTSLYGVGELVPGVPLDEIDPEHWRRACAYVRERRERFVEPFRSTDERHLAVKGAFLTVRKRVPVRSGAPIARRDAAAARTGLHARTTAVN